MHKHLLLSRARERHAPNRQTPDARSPARAGRPRRADGDVLGIVCAPAATYRGYSVTIVLDRLSHNDRWSGRAIVTLARASNRPLVTLPFHELPRQRGGDRARLIVLRAAFAAIDRVEDIGHGLWPAAPLQ